MYNQLPRYVLITPARNEIAFIEQTIQSVITQTILPLRWVVVSDGSTDGTDEIVTRYAADHPWITLMRMPERRERHFSGKAHAFNAGCTNVIDLQYEVIGNVDADVSFDKEYFQFLLTKFAENPKLGVAGTPFREGSFQYDFRFTSIEHVSGQIQLFRRACFEEIGGYPPLKTGGIDLVAVMTARMKGWQTRTFLEKPYLHHRKMGSAKHTALIDAFDGGRVDYLLGCHPMYQLVRCIYRLHKRRPIVLYASLCAAGFFWAMLTRAEKILPADLVQFRRIEERHRLRDLLKKALRSVLSPLLRQHRNIRGT
jgi:glycosyltransferase involved in cell wall biosynthesis